MTLWPTHKRRAATARAFNHREAKRRARARRLGTNTTKNGEQR